MTMVALALAIAALILALLCAVALTFVYHQVLAMKTDFLEVSGRIGREIRDVRTEIGSQAGQ